MAKDRCIDEGKRLAVITGQVIFIGFLMTDGSVNEWNHGLSNPFRVFL